MQVADLFFVLFQISRTRRERASRMSAFFLREALGAAAHCYSSLIQIVRLHILPPALARLGVVRGDALPLCGSRAELCLCGARIEPLFLSHDTGARALEAVPHALVDARQRQRRLDPGIRKPAV